MRLVILLAILAIALPFIISGAATPFGSAVSFRFLERPTATGAQPYTVPGDPNMPELTAASLKAWVQTHLTAPEETQINPVKGYAMRVIPLDILYLIFLGTFLGVASTSLAGVIRWPSAIAGLPVGIWWMLPAIYMFCDLAEDTMIYSMLTWPSAINDWFGTLTHVRAWKIRTVTLGMVQVFALDILSFVLTRP